MDFRSKIEAHLQAFLEQRTDLFLIDLKISAGDDVVVVLDGDQGVSIQDCLDASRAIEFNMDREAHDFSLQVMSAGLSEPLRLPRQFAKNLGRMLRVVLQDDTEVEGELIRADEAGVVLLLRYRRPKAVGKGKEDVEEERAVAYDAIKKAVVHIKF
ncbi:ribosome assembly cofactor RimP [Bergeyella sp. RCAD1439]|uniref:ribosome assembly cofactor RimP n=1 Tax=Bergeyella anatis TaxID=3113737 RepID=UPI002E19F148|nr:ribosome assembly cofactor RimP [Bergeyella sp. RCAD1439]